MSLGFEWWDKQSFENIYIHTTTTLRHSGLEPSRAVAAALTFPLSAIRCCSTVFKCKKQTFTHIDVKCLSY